MVGPSRCIIQQVPARRSQRHPGLSGLTQSSHPNYQIQSFSTVRLIHIKRYQVQDSQYRIPPALEMEGVRQVTH